MKKLNLNAIRIDGGTQSRVEINMEAVADYAEAVKVGIEFPAVVVFHDGSDYWLADGFHRYHAHKQADKASIHAEVRNGTARDAILYSLSANCTHGLRRTNADKRKAVQTLLADAEWAAWSDRKIAEACGVGHPFVAALRRPAVAEKQQENRAASAAKKAPKVESDSTPAASSPVQKVESDSTSRGQDKAKREQAQAQEHAVNDQLAEAQHTITELADENVQLQDRLAVAAMDASDEEKAQAAETMRGLRARVTALEAEVDALKVSRDTYMREANEAKKSAIYWRKQAEKAAKAAA